MDLQKKPTTEEIHTRLQQLVDSDQEMVAKCTNGKSPLDHKLVEKNTEVLKTLLPQKGCFTVSEYGEQTVNNAWLLVQHADHDVAFQEEYLKRLLENASDVNPRNIAYLTDRIAKNKGQLQVYGTQCFKSKDDGLMHPLPMIEPEKVDQRRADMQLEPLREYLDTTNRFYSLA